MRAMYTIRRETVQVRKIMAVYLGFGNDLNCNRLILELALFNFGRASMPKMSSPYFLSELVFGSKILTVTKVLVQRLLLLGSSLLGDRPLFRLPTAKTLSQGRLDVLGRRWWRKRPAEESPGSRSSSWRRRDTSRQGTGWHSMGVGAGPRTLVGGASGSVLHGLHSDGAVSRSGGHLIAITRDDEGGCIGVSFSSIALEIRFTVTLTHLKIVLRRCIRLKDWVKVEASDGEDKFTADLIKTRERLK